MNKNNGMWYKIRGIRTSMGKENNYNRRLYWKTAKENMAANSNKFNILENLEKDSQSVKDITGQVQKK